MKPIKKMQNTSVKKRLRKVPKEPRKRTRVVYSSKGIVPHEWRPITKARQPGATFGYFITIAGFGDPYQYNSFYSGTCKYCGSIRKTIHKGTIEVLEHCPKAQAAIMDSVLD